MTTNKFKVLANKEQLVDQTVAQTGGDYTPPAEGLARLRLVAYVEVGKQRTTFNKVESFKPFVWLTFELSGKKWEPKNVDGKLIPERLTIKVPLSTNTKAKYYKLFLKMRDDRQDITHMAEMLGDAFMGKIVHRQYTVTKDGKEEKRVSAELVDKEKNWTITPPFIEEVERDDEGEPTGDVKRTPVKVAEPVSPLRLFIWDLADKEQWDSLFIEGADKEKQVLQLAVVKAKNFIGSPAEAVAEGSAELMELAAKGVGGRTADTPADDDGDDGDDEEKSSAAKKASKTTNKVNAKKPDAEADAGAGDLGDID